MGLHRLLAAKEESGGVIGQNRLAGRKMRAANRKAYLICNHIARGITSFQGRTGLLDLSAQFSREVILLKRC